MKLNVVITMSNWFNLKKKNHLLEIQLLACAEKIDRLTDYIQDKHIKEINLEARIQKAKMFIDTKCVKGVVMGHIYNILEGGDSNDNE